MFCDKKKACRDHHFVLVIFTQQNKIFDIRKSFVLFIFDQWQLRRLFLARHAVALKARTK